MILEKLFINIPMIVNKRIIINKFRLFNLNLINIKKKKKNIYIYILI